MAKRLKLLLAGTLRRQLVLGMGLVVAGMMSMFVWDLSQRQQTVLREQQSEQAIALARSTAASTAVWVASRDFSGLQEIVEGLSIYPDLRYAMVLDLKGQVLAHSDPTRRGQYLNDMPQQATLQARARGAGLVDVVSPVLLARHQVGWVRIGLARDSLDAQLTRVTRDGLLYVLVAVALSVLFATLAARHLTRRLYAIQQVADAVQAGQSGLRAVVPGADEAAQLALQFNRMLSALEQQEQALKGSEQKFVQLFMKVPVPLGVVNKDGVILHFNESFTELLGYVREDMPTLQEWWRLAYPDEAYRHWVIESWDAAVAKAMRSGAAIGPLEYTISAKNGSRHIMLIGGTTLEDSVLATFTDITERRAAQEAQRIAAIAFESQEGIVVTDAANVILRVNQAFTTITGYTAQEATGQTPRLLRSGRHDAAFYAAMWACIVRSGTWQGEVWNRRKNGEVFPEWLTITAVKGDAGQTTHYVAAFTDITARKLAEEQIQTLAFYDTLTGLPNRRLLMDRLELALAASSRHQRNGALLFVDLDNFKTVNDTLGHYQGDLLLQQVAKRLVACIREGDTVARLGGDEFVVMLQDLSDNMLEAVAQAETVGQKVLATLDQTCQLGYSEHHGTASIGITVFGGEQPESIDEPLKRADLAMYQAKAAGRNALRFFDPQMQAVVASRAALEAGLRDALAQAQLVLYYQAQVAGAGHLNGVEALVRWQHPQRGLVPPADFIPLAEETGLILPLGAWVMETACSQLAAWAQRPESARLTVAVNVSARQFHQRDFVEQVLAVLQRTGANPKLLKLELTESLLVSNVEDVIAKMTALKSSGVGFSLDDFGTGYSSLYYLKRLPLDQLKIDQGFVRNILIDANDAAIARMVIVLADSLGLAVIAEGVETVAQRDFLASQGCHACQGYLFSRPLPLEEFEVYMLGLETA